MFHLGTAISHARWKDLFEDFIFSPFFSFAFHYGGVEQNINNAVVGESFDARKKEKQPHKHTHTHTHTHTIWKKLFTARSPLQPPFVAFLSSGARVWPNAGRLTGLKQQSVKPLQEVMWHRAPYTVRKECKQQQQQKSIKHCSTCSVCSTSRMLLTLILSLARTFCKTDQPRTRRCCVARTHTHTWWYFFQEFLSIPLQRILPSIAGPSSSAKCSLWTKPRTEEACTVRAIVQQKKKTRRKSSIYSMFTCFPIMYALSHRLNAQHNTHTHSANV